LIKATKENKIRRLKKLLAIINQQISNLLEKKKNNSNTLINKITNAKQTTKQQMQINHL
jgi:DNA topoisomerase VI subunit B